MPTSTAVESELTGIIRAYNEVTERLKRSHEALAREVCRLRDELHHKNKELQRRERLAALGEMAAGVAHEIRNPLGGIGIYASLLERDLAGQPKQLDMVRKMSGGIGNLDAIVGDILAFAGDSDPVPERVCMGRILEDALDRTMPKADAVGIRIDVDESLEPAYVFCDANQITRALINLILNALDAVGEDGQVRIRCDGGSLAGGLLRVAVEDSGPGITPQLLHRIFNPFFTTKHTGTGLGLAIVHRIAESNGGSISAANRSDGGAAFVLSIPQAPGQDHNQDAGGME